MSDIRSFFSNKPPPPKVVKSSHFSKKPTIIVDSDEDFQKPSVSETASHPVKSAKKVILDESHTGDKRASEDVVVKRSSKKAKANELADISDDDSLMAIVRSASKVEPEASATTFASSTGKKKADPVEKKEVTAPIEKKQPAAKREKKSKPERHELVMEPNPPKAKKEKSEPAVVEHTPEKAKAKAEKEKKEKPTPAAGDDAGEKPKNRANFWARAPPPMKGKKDIPTGAPGCLAGLTFVITGVLESLERDEMSDLLKSYGGRVTGSVSKKTTYMVAGTDAGESKTNKAKELGVEIVSEDDVLEMIRSRPANEAAIQSTTSTASTAAKKTKSTASKVVGQKRKAKSDEDSAEETVTQTPEKAKRALSTGSAISPAATTTTTKSSSPVHTPEPIQLKQRTDDPDNQLWVDKYAPKRLSDLVGNKTPIERMVLWLRTWHDIHTRHEPIPDHPLTDIGGKKGEKKGKTEFGLNCILVSGPPGIGKSSSVGLAVALAGFQKIEFNASDTRSKKALQQVVSQLIHSQTISTTSHSLAQCCLVMDEVDGMSGGDRGGMAELILLIKKTQMPIICMCNDAGSQKIRSLKNYCMDMPFRRPTTQQIADRLLTVCRAENIRTDKPAMEKLAESTHGDIRQALHMLQLWQSSLSGSISFNDVKTSSKSFEKDIAITPFDAGRQLLEAGASRLSVSDRMELYFHDSSLVPLLVQENYLKTRHDLKDCLKAAESVSDSDMCDVMVRRGGGWSLMPAHAVLSSAKPSYYCAGALGRLDFSSWLGKYSTTTRRARLLADIEMRARSTVSGSLSALTMEYIPAFARTLATPLVKEGVDGIPKILQILEDYGLIKDDFDAIMELGALEGKDLLESVPGTVKAALTRAYNSSSHAVKAVRIAKSLGGGLGAAAEEEGDDDATLLEGDEDEDEEKEEKSSMFKEKVKRASKPKVVKAKAEAKPAKVSAKGGSRR